MGTGTPAAGGFGALLHSLRQGAGLTQEELAQAAGISVRALSYMERGRSRGPQRRTVSALAAALRLSPQDARELERLASLGRPRRATATEVLPPVAVVDAVAPTGAPDLLPRAPRGFHGRAAELAAVSRAAAGEAPVCLVIGPAGVGKTALVLHWAHHSRARFPDGRLHADLRGCGDQGEPSLTEVLREFLLALGVAHGRIPESVNGAAALFRSLAADRRLLVVLDNARDSEQVRPLLPGGRRCVTVVTSRHRLPGLIVTDTARPVAVDVLGPTDARLAIAAAAATASLLTAVPAQADGVPTYTCDKVKRDVKNPKGAFGEDHCVASNGALVPSKILYHFAIKFDFKLVQRDGNAFLCTKPEGPYQGWVARHYNDDLEVYGYQCELL
ncbi:hypothetical protein ADK86_03815 [Streptomyces sp. NRRL F-5755]|uniref:helix-turn-helix domain-containing protein n=1 Tax=Streptomyces sp. NRRL F-5755 TaxID=1519475 RepID=UPI0006AEF796|nr:hypothetical protein ADK86_03815 [Streptomyces sp. NRRL F-5755]